MTNLLKIEGKRARRYVKGRLVETAEMDQAAPSFRLELEEFRMKGMPPEEVLPGQVAFDRIAAALEASST